MILNKSEVFDRIRTPLPELGIDDGFRVAFWPHFTCSDWMVKSKRWLIDEALPVSIWSDGMIFTRRIRCREQWNVHFLHWFRLENLFSKSKALQHDFGVFRMRIVTRVDDGMICRISWSQLNPPSALWSGQRHKYGGRVDVDQRQVEGFPHVFSYVEQLVEVILEETGSLVQKWILLKNFLEKNEFSWKLFLEKKWILLKKNKKKNFL